jgi:hypothetical protein
MPSALKGDLTSGGCQPKRALTSLDGLVLVARQTEIMRQMGRDPSQPPLIAQGRGEGVGLVQVADDLAVGFEGEERIAKVEPKIDRLLGQVSTFRQMLQGD